MPITLLTLKGGRGRMLSEEKTQVYFFKNHKWANCDFIVPVLTHNNRCILLIASRPAFLNLSGFADRQGGRLPCDNGSM